MTSSKASIKLSSQSRIEAFGLVCTEKSSGTYFYMCSSTKSQGSIQLEVWIGLKSHLWFKHQKSPQTTQITESVCGCIISVFLRSMLTNCFDFVPAGALFSVNLIQCYY